MEEQEIDLRPFILPLVRRWKIIALVTLVFILVAIGQFFMSPPGYTATSDTLIKPKKSQPNFDPRFPNESSAGSSLNREKALKSLAESVLLEERVIPQLPPDLIEPNFRTGDLARSMKFEQEGELIRFTTSHKTFDGSRTIADTWARTYVNLVNQIYSDVVFDQVQKELNEAQKRYDTAQKELEDFVLKNDLTPLNRQIEILSTLLSQSRASMLEQFNKYLARARDKEYFLLNLQDLRRQIETGQSGNLGNIMAALSIRARFGQGGSLPVQLQLDNLEALAQDRVTTADIDQMIKSTEMERDELVKQHQELAKNSTTGNIETIALPLEVRDSYEKQIRELQMKVEQQSAQQKLLAQNRDIAMDTLVMLKKKLDEQRVTQGFSENQLVFVGTTVSPPRILRPLVIRGAIGFVIGAFLSISAILVIDVVRPRLAALYKESLTHATG